jgi:hypothetical protein
MWLLLVSLTNYIRHWWQIIIGTASLGCGTVVDFSPTVASYSVTPSYRNVVEIAKSVNHVETNLISKYL